MYITNILGKVPCNLTLTVIIISVMTLKKQMDEMQQWNRDVTVESTFIDVHVGKQLFSRTAFKKGVPHHSISLVQ